MWGVREQRLVFGEVAGTYDEVRPGYPEALVGDVLAFAGSPSRALEVGSGTGRATLAFAARGVRVLGIEPSPEMAARIASHPLVEIVAASFEDWTPAERFPLLFSAQAWHWVRPEVARVKPRECLVPGGTLALFWNRPRWSDASLRDALDAVYERLAPDLDVREPGYWGARLETEDDEVAADLRAAFGNVDRRTYDWLEPYTTARYLRLLSTQSDHRMLPPDRRAALLEAVGEVVAGGIEIDYRTSLFLARV
jgi:SAM-dependent methyltransferase